jgi:hypothetical protein
VNIKHFSMRRATRSVRPAAMASLALATLGAAACGSSYAREGQTASYLIVNRLIMAEASSGGSAPFQSDVMSDDGSIFEDGAVVSLTAAMHDVTNVNGPTANNRITVTRYHVSFRRSDGRNVPGVDVPYPFDGAATATVGVGDTITIPFVMVRIQAKIEQPLASLRGHGGAAAISTIADVTFYGHDQAGREVSVTGSTSVNFADWAG